MRSRSAAFLLAALIALAACSSSSGTSAPPTAASIPTSTTTTGSVASPAPVGCGPAAAAAAAPAGTTVARSLSIAGHVRVVRVHLPTHYTGTHAVPLVLNMHGSGSDAVQQEGVSGMDVTADRATFIVAYPQAAIPAGTGFDWNVPGVPLLGGKAVPSGAADDVRFLSDLVTTLGSRYCIDADRVYATGLSGGARIASQLGCDASTVFAAIAPVTGLRFPAPCSAARAVPVLTFHGTADPVDPYNGNGQAYWTYSVPVAAQRWASHDGCATTPTTTQPAASVTLTAYAGCRDDAAVELYTITGEGHEWTGGPTLPRSVTRALGPQTHVIDANDIMWAFFSSHPRP